jgi:methyl-accepting chemotaxis protein
MVTKISDRVKQTPTAEGKTQNSVELPPARESRELLASESSSLERFAKSFEVSARRWELVVYPSLFAFILLAGYGFFLIYSLTQDMHTLARNMDPNMSGHMETMAEHIAILSVSIELMGEEIETMGENVALMTNEVDHMNTKLSTLEPMLVNMSEMNKAIHTMAANTSAMTANTGTMTRNTGVMSGEMNRMARPFNMMQSFFPW